MDATQNPTLPTPPKKDELNLIVNEIIIQNVDLTSKDIGNYRSAQIAAMSVYFPNFTRLYDLYEDIRQDCHLIGIVGKRIDAVRNNKIHFVDAAGQKNDALDTLIRSQKFRELLKLLMEKKFWGRSGMEFIPGREFDFKEIPRKHIKPKWGIISTEQSGQEGFTYEGVQNIWIVGSPTDLGLYLALSVPAIYKRGDLADWSQYVEIFGQPMRTIEYDPHDKQMKAELRQVIDEAGSSLALMIPRGSELKLMDGKTSNGDGQLQERLKDTLNNEMSVAVLGNTETTTNGKTGTGAKSGIHQEQQIIFTKSDVADIENLLNSEQFLAIVASYGFPVAGGRFQFVLEADPVKVKGQVDVIAAVRQMGTPVGDEYVYEVTGIPKPADYDVQKAQAAQEALNASKALKTLDSGNPDDTPPPDLKPAKPGTKQLSDRHSTWYAMRTALADFFAPAQS